MKVHCNNNKPDNEATGKFSLETTTKQEEKVFNLCSENERARDLGVQRHN